MASAFADRHPGVLNLDIDQVAALVGGYRQRFSAAFEAGVLWRRRWRGSTSPTATT